MKHLHDGDQIDPSFVLFGHGTAGGWPNTRYGQYTCFHIAPLEAWKKYLYKENQNVLIKFIVGLREEKMIKWL